MTVSEPLTPSVLRQLADDWEALAYNPNAARDLIFNLNTATANLLAIMPEECTMFGIEFPETPDVRDSYHRRKDDD